MKEAKKLLSRKTTKARKSSALLRMSGMDGIFDKREELGSSVAEAGVPSELNTHGDEDEAESE